MPQMFFENRIKMSDEYTRLSWIAFELSTCITDTRSVFMEIVRFFRIFRKITVTYWCFWRLSGGEL